MEDLSCKTTIVTKNLALHFDINDIESWDMNTGLSVNSLTEWNGAKSEKIFLLDYGLTQFDNGLTNQLYTSKQLYSTGTTLQLRRVGANSLTSTLPDYTNYFVSGVTGNSIGEYFDLNGGYLQNHFKLHNYNVELFPPRYNNGITIETSLLIGPNSFDNEGFFYHMGARAEDKFQPLFSGETKFNQNVESQTAPSSNGNITIETVTESFSGITTQAGDHLHQYIFENQPPKGIRDMDNPTEPTKVDVGSGDTWNNIIGFYFTKNGNIGIQTINSDGSIKKQITDNAITSTGWTEISIVFDPYTTIDDPDLLECMERRTGRLMIYVNGSKFYSDIEFEEFFFRGFKNEKELQLGVPYNISWGGASFGLKNSFHYDFEKHIIFDEEDQTYLDTNFAEVVNPLIVPECDPTGTSINHLSITKEDILDYIEPCSGTSINRGVMNITITGETGTTAETVTNKDYFIQYTPTTASTKIDLLSNRIYNFSAMVKDTGIFQGNINSSIGLAFSGNPNITILESNPYVIPYRSTTSTTNVWVPINYKLKINDNTTPQNIIMGIEIKSDANLVSGATLYLDNIEFVGQDGRGIHIKNKELLIENSFDRSFIGGIQKLRIYDRALSSNEIIHNAKIDSSLYGYTVSVGGRCISR